MLTSCSIRASALTALRQLGDSRKNAITTYTQILQECQPHHANRIVIVAPRNSVLVLVLGIGYLALLQLSSRALLQKVSSFLEVGCKVAKR